jgi:mannitol/fructose-specific phosphotransferase system IIA component (Ntr-type)
LKTLAHYTSPQLIQSPLAGRDAAAAISELCSLLRRFGRVGDSDVFYDRVIRRESMSSTAAPPGWALPHARSHDIPELVFALGQSVEPLAWFGPAREPVRWVFLFAVPESQAAPYLALVSALARFSRDPANVERLLRALDRQALFDLLGQVQLREPAFATV